MIGDKFDVLRTTEQIVPHKKKNEFLISAIIRCRFKSNISMYWLLLYFQMLTFIIVDFLYLSVPCPSRDFYFIWRTQLAALAASILVIDATVDSCWHHYLYWAGPFMPQVVILVFVFFLFVATTEFNQTFLGASARSTLFDREGLLQDSWCS